jgi:hypothetical protein
VALPFGPSDFKVLWSKATSTIQKVVGVFVRFVRRFSLLIVCQLIIFSDMEFDDANTPHFRDTTLSEWNPTAQEMISDMYSDAVVSKIVYWNLNARNQKKFTS